jgi:ankyrin repeat protein
MLTLIRRMFEAGANPNRATLYPTPGTLGNIRLNPAPTGSSPFHIAANSHNWALVRLMAGHGADPNLVRKDGHTPFTVAVAANDLEIVKDLVACGANLNARYNPVDLVPDKSEAIARPRKDQTIMHIAAVAQAYSVVEYLFNHGVPLDTKNADGETPLALAENMEIFDERLAMQGTGSGGGRPVPRRTETTDAIRKLLSTR